MSKDEIHPFEDDNFQRIRGIGAGIEKRLKNARIRSFDDLASSTPAHLAEVLKGLPGMTRDNPALANWIRQAEELAGSRFDQQEETQEIAAHLDGTGEAENQARYENFTIVLRIGDDQQVKRTRVVHLRDSSERAWHGWEGKNVLDFILYHAGVEDRQDILPARSELQPVGSPVGRMAREGKLQKDTRGRGVKQQQIEGELVITMMEVMTLDQSNSTHIIKKGEAFEVCLGLNLSQAADPANTIYHYSAAVFARELNTHIRQKVAAGQGKVTLSSQASIKIQGIPLPSGVYRFEAMVMLSSEENPTPDRRRTAFLDGGLLQVD